MKTMNKIKKFVKERDKMLKKCSVEELRKFVNSHADIYGIEYVEIFNLMNDEIAEATLHKMIVNCINLPQKLRLNSKHWLVNHFYD